MSAIAYVSSLPDCNICAVEGKPKVAAEYDVRTKDGRWANVCEEHRLSHAMYSDLGTGKGQELIVGERPQPSTQDKQEQVQDAMRRGDIDSVWDLIGDEDPAEWL